MSELKSMPLEEAIDQLVELYRQRLQDDPALVENDWFDHVEQLAEVKEDGDELVLLIDE
jgi:hypothetical protein